MLLLTTSGFAQTGADTGLQGRVTDQTGASVPGASVTLIRAATGEQRTAQTNDSGDWEVRLLSPGDYKLTFEMAGFKKLVRDGVSVTTAQMGTVNVEMTVGNIGQSIEVVADAEMISSTSATVVRTLDHKELESLPTSSRNFSQLLMIETGVSADISELLDNSNSNVSPSVNGARTTNNSFVFNGVDTTSLLCCNSRTESSGGSLSRNMAPAPETLEEVKLQTSLYDAATGRNGGGNFMLVSKSGTNEFHGTVYHYFQNDKLMANEFFLNRAGVERPMLRRNEGGATVGGPIVKGRTFFFGSFQLTRAKTSFVDSANKILRLPQALTDDRSDTGINNFLASIWPKAAGPVNTSVLNPVSKAILQAKFPDGSYLIPSGGNGRDCRKVGTQAFPSCQVVTVIPASYSQNQFSANIDHQITQNNRLSGKFFYTNQPSLDPLSSSRAISRFERNRDTQQRTLSLTDTAILSPRMANEFRAGFFRNRNDIKPVSYFTNEQFGLMNPLASIRPDLVTMDIRGERDVGDRFTFGTYAQDIRDVQNTFTFADTLSFTKSKHSIKLGGEFRRHQLNGKLQELANGRKNFRDWFAFLTVGFVNPADGNRARQISDTAVNYGETVRGYRMSDYSFFLADDWKVNSKLTLNVGVRWEYFGFPWEVNGMLSAFDYRAALATGYAADGFLFASNFKPESIPGATQQANLRIADSRSIIHADKNDFMPRFGFAYSPFGGSKVVIRGGYGIFFERTTGAFANSLRQSAPFFREAQINDQNTWHSWAEDYPPFPIPTFIVGFSSSGVPSVRRSDVPGTTFETYEAQMIDPNLATPYTQQWSLNAQWEFKPSWMWEIGYAGTKGTKLLQIYNINRAIDVDTVGFMARPGNVPNGGLIGNYYGPSSKGVFVNLKTPPATCNLKVNPSSCVVDPEVRSPLLGFDEDEGVNFLSSNANSIYNSLQSSLQKRFAKGYMFKVNYTFSRAIDTFSDESKFQVENDDLNPKSNRGLSDFHRKHRLIASGSWDLPFKKNKWVQGWSISGISTFQSGTPFTVRDTCCSGFLYPNGTKRPSLASGVTHADLVAQGAVNENLDNYLQFSDYVMSGAQFGTLGRNTLIGPDQRRVDLVLSKLTTIREGLTLELRGEFFNAFNTVTFREPASAGKTINDASFGQITRTRGGPRVIQLGLKLKF